RALDEFLACPEPRALTSYGGALGFDFHRPFAVLLVGANRGSALGSPTDPVPIVPASRTLDTILRESCDQWIVVPRADALLVLASPYETHASRYPTHFAQRVADELQQAGAVPLCVAAGPT